MGHSRPDITQQYTDEVELYDLADALARAAETRMSQASPDLTTLEGEFADELQTFRWRRRESNPRKISISQGQLLGRRALDKAARHFASVRFNAVRSESVPERDRDRASADSRSSGTA